MLCYFQSIGGSWAWADAPSANMLQYYALVHSYTNLQHVSRLRCTSKIENTIMQTGTAVLIIIFNCWISFVQGKQKKILIYGVVRFWSLHRHQRHRNKIFHMCKTSRYSHASISEVFVINFIGFFYIYFYHLSFFFHSIQFFSFDFPLSLVFRHILHFYSQWAFCFSHFTHMPLIHALVHLCACGMDIHFSECSCVYS